MEVLYDLDTEARHLCESLGIARHLRRCRELARRPGTPEDRAEEQADEQSAHENRS
jgi:hypothetical protein